MKKTIALLAFFVAATAQAAITPELQRIKDVGVLKIGVRSNAAPFSVYNAGTPTGYVVELCQKIVANIQKEIASPVQVKYVEVTPKDRFEMVADGRVDMECGTTTVTQERKARADFSVNTFITSTNFITLAQNKIETTGEFYPVLVEQKKTVALMKDTSHESIVKRWTKGAPVNIIYVNSIDEGLDKVASGEAFVFVQDRVLIERSMYAKKLDRQKFYLSPSALTLEPYSIMVRRGNRDLLDIVNTSLREMYTSGAALGRMDAIFKDNGMTSNQLTKDSIKRPSVESAFP